MNNIENIKYIYTVANSLKTDIVVLYPNRIIGSDKLVGANKLFTLIREVYIDTGIESPRVIETKIWAQIMKKYKDTLEETGREIDIYRYFMKYSMDIFKTNYIYLYPTVDNIYNEINQSILFSRFNFKEHPMFEEINSMKAGNGEVFLPILDIYRNHTQYYLTYFKGFIPYTSKDSVIIDIFINDIHPDYFYTKYSIDKKKYTILQYTKNKRF